MKFIGAHIFSYDATFRGDVTIEGNLTVSNSVSQTISFGDNDKLKFGDGNDLEIFHDGSNSYINQRNTGNLIIQASSADKDIILKSDDGGGSATAYVTLDGGLGFTILQKNLRANDDVRILVGSSQDAEFFHDGLNTSIRNTTGDLQIRQAADDKDIIFKCDDGSGGETTYFYLDGSSKEIRINEEMQFEDNVKLNIGTGEDLRFKHNGTDSSITNITGNLKITNQTNGGDIILQADDGSGADTAYLTLDGSTGYVRFEDNRRIAVGSSDDFMIYHDGTDTKFSNVTGTLQFHQNVNDSDIIFFCDDGSGGTTSYLTLDGSATNMKAYKNMRFTDNVQAQFGDNGDFTIYHDGSNTYLEQINAGTGNIVIKNSNDDADIIFQSDDGSGGVETYFFLDGSIGLTTFPDNKKLGFGSGNDLQIKHSGSGGFITNVLGDLTISTSSDDGDIKFLSDDGSGGTTEYFRLDGGLGYNYVSKKFRFIDSVYAEFGSGGDFFISHDGSNTILQNSTGDLRFNQTLDDGDIIFNCDDGSGGVATYMTIDGSDTDIKVHKNFEIEKTLTMQHTADPSDPATGHSVMWSDTSGNLKVKINVGGSVVTRTLATGTD